VRRTCIGGKRVDTKPEKEKRKGRNKRKKKEKSWYPPRKGKPQTKEKKIAAPIRIKEKETEKK